MSSEGAGAVTREQNQLGGLVPNLRFPEFSDAGDWQVRKLSELLFEPKQRNRGLQYGPEHVLSVSGEFGCVNQMEFMGRSYAGASVKDYHIVESGDIVYTKSPLKACPNGIIKENKGRSGIVSVMYAVYRPTALGNASYLDQYFSSDFNLNCYLQPLVKKGPKNSILVNNSDVLGGDIYAPEAQEQQKIAVFLSSIDALIGVELGRLAALKDHKEGLMQQLFPAPGDTTPRLRFPEFDDADDWDESDVGELCQLQDGYAFSSNDFVGCASDSIQVIRITDINNQNKNENKVYIPTRLIDELRLTRFMVQEGDLLLSLTGAAGFNFFFWNSVPAVMNQRTMKITLKDSENDALKVLLSPLVDKKINAHGSGQNNNLSKESLKAVSLLIPKAAEQERIAHSLTSIDSLIEMQGEKIAALNAHKRGLMQQLFPVADEVQA